MTHSIKLEKGKEYLVYITKTMGTSVPIVSMYQDYNPIFIFSGKSIDMPTENFIALDMDINKFPFEDSLDSEFPKMVIQSKRVMNLFNSLLHHQKEIWVALWKNHPHFQPLFDNPQIKPLGLSSKLTYRLSNKVFQYELLKDIVPIPKFVVTTKKDALKYFDRVKTKEGVFTSLEYGSGGSGTKIHIDKDSLKKYLNEINDEEFLMINALKLKATIGIDLLIANENEIFVYCIGTEIFDGLKCLGCVYPSDLSEKIKKECYEITLKLGKKIAQVDKGVRGYFNINLNIDTKGNVYFSEINARYGGSSGICVLMMDQVKPPHATKMVDLGVMAMKEGTFKDFKLWGEPKGYFWCKKTINAEHDGVIMPFSIPHDPYDLFKKREGTILMGQLMPGTRVKRNDNLGVMISLQKTRKALEDSMRNGDKLIKKYVKPN